LIKLWEPADKLGAISVIREVFDEYGFTWEEDGYHADLYDVPKIYFADGHRFYVAISQGEVVGTVALEFFDPISGEPGQTTLVEDTVRIASTDCSLERLYVRPSARKSGIGGMLLEHVINAAQESGCQAMEIWSDKRFEAAHRLYHRFGAVVVADRICDDPDESPEWGLRLPLHK
jgi:GNAT superfamily N-acetyltransferase